MKGCFSLLCYSKNPSKEVKELPKNIGFKVSHCSHRDASFTNGTEKFLCKSCQKLIIYVIDIFCIN